MKLSVFGGVSYNGFKCDVLKSGVNKYTRRGISDKLIYCIVELEMFKKLGDKSKAIRSNMRNRVIITLNEDISISDWKVYLKVGEGMALWEKNRELDNIDGKKGLIESLDIMCKSEKIRFGSLIRGFYYGYQVKDIREKYKKNYEGVEEIGEIREEFFNKEKDKPELKNYISGFLNNFEKGNMFCFYWMMKILEVRGRCGRRFGKYKSCYIIWYILFEKLEETNVNLKKLINLLFYWYTNFNNSRNENWLYLTNAIYFVMKEKEYNWNEEISGDVYSNDEIENFFKFNITNKIEIDDFVFDMHCNEGRMKGKNDINFVNSGMVVENEYKKFDKGVYEEIYINLKMRKGNKKKKKKNKKINDYDLENLKFVDFEELIGSKSLNGKLCTESNCGKEMVFRNNGKIYKEVNKGFNYGKDCVIVDDLKEIFGLRKIGMYRVKSDKIVKRVDRKILSWVDNMKVIDKKCIYLIMDDFENTGHLDKIMIKKDKKIELEYLKIIMFRGVFRVTDGNMRNVLVNKKMELVSIDENNINKRKTIFNKLGRKLFDKELIKKSLEFICSNKTEKLKGIKEKLEKFKMGDLYEKIETNFNKLEIDILEEFTY